MTPERRIIGLKLGVAILFCVAALFALGATFGPKVAVDAPVPLAADTRLVETVLNDAASLEYLAKLDAHAPVAAQTFRLEAAFAIKDGWTRDEVGALLMEAAFGQFRSLAVDLQTAPTASYDAILAHFGEGMATLKAQRSAWCHGPTVAAFLTENDDKIVPQLLAQFPYGSDGYDWALEWGGLFLDAAAEGRRVRVRHGRPDWRDEVALQQEGLAVGTEKWSLALQIGAFSTSEGQSYEMMQDAIGAMDVCGLGLAIPDVSGRLEPDVRGRIWADLMPEIMYGNTPYVLARVNDYFFIG